jgi:hypothetical protein
MEGHQGKNSDPSQDHLIGETASRKGKCSGPGQLSPHLLLPSPLSLAIVCREYCQPQNGREEGRKGLFHLLARALLGNKLPAVGHRFFPSPLPPFVHPFPFFLPQSANIFGPKMRPTAMMGSDHHSHPFLAGCALGSKRQLSAIDGSWLPTPPFEEGPIRLLLPEIYE